MTEDVLFTRQRHEAEKAGLHWDYRIVVGNKAYSFATKKEMPEVGKSIMLWEQPVHDRDYALSKKVVIPTGQYGAGTTTLDWVKKGKAHMEPGKIVVETNEGRFLLKKMPNYEDGTGWLFKQLPKEEKENMEKKVNKYLEKIASTAQVRQLLKLDSSKRTLKGLTEKANRASQNNAITSAYKGVLRKATQIPSSRRVGQVSISNPVGKMEVGMSNAHFGMALRKSLGK